MNGHLRGKKLMMLHHTPVFTQTLEHSTVGSKIAEIFCRSDNGTKLGHAFKLLSQTAVSSNCNYCVLKRVKKHSNRVLKRQETDTWSGFCFCLCILEAHQPHRRIYWAGTHNYSKSRPTSANILHKMCRGLV